MNEIERLIEKITNCQTMPELKALRVECIKVKPPKDFNLVKEAWMKNKRRLNRIPLRERTW